MALGADRERILKMVLRQGATHAVVGIVAGIGIALLIATGMGAAIENTLFGVSGRDPLTYLAVAALLSVVWFTATVFPARRATRVHPVTALRAE